MARIRSHIILGMLSCTPLTDAMMLAAARTLAESSPALKDSSASLLPALRDIRRVAAEIATAVGLQAQQDGVAPKVSRDELRQRVHAMQWFPTYPSTAVAAR
jgi:malate dehydrogenase (oxaloacetate-decarboxylating)